MGGVRKTGKKKAKAGAGNEGASEVKPSRTKKQLIRRLVKKMETGLLGKNDPKGTVGDLVRLLQLDDELTVKKPREIKVRWVEPTDEGSGSGK